MTILIYLGTFNIIAAIVAIAWLETRPATRESVQRVSMGDIGRLNLCQGIINYSNDEEC